MVKRGLSRKVVNQRISRVLHVFRWGTEEGRELVPESVAAVVHLLRPLPAFRTPARDYEPVQPATPEAVSAVVASANPLIAAMVRLQRLTGMRPGEVRFLRR